MIHPVYICIWNEKTKTVGEQEIERDIVAIKNYEYPGFPHVTARGTIYCYGKWIDVFHDDGIWVSKGILRKREYERTKNPEHQFLERDDR